MKRNFSLFSVAALLVASIACLYAGHPFAATGAAVAALPALSFALSSGYSPPSLFLPSPLARIGWRESQAGRIGDRTTLDANETAFFERQLEYVKSRTYDIKYAELKAVQLIPVSTEAGSGAETITYYTYDQTGIAKLIASYADDLPRSDVTGRRNTAEVHSIGNSYGYSVQEIRAAMQAGVPLTQRKATAARRAHDQKVNTIAFFGDAAANLPGLLNNVNVMRSTVPNDGTGAATTFVSKTPDQVLRDLNSVANAIFITTLGVETPDTLLMPLSQYSYIGSTPRTSTTDTSIMQWFLKNQEFIKKIEWVAECKGAGVLVPNADVMVAYRRDEDHLTLEIPQPFEQFPEQPRNLEFVVPCHSRIGGVLIYYPLSVNIGEGI